MDDEDDDGTPSNGCQESTSVYQIHKILSSDQYTIGKSVSEYIESFDMQYVNLKEARVNFLNQLTNQQKMFLQINFSDNDTS